MEFILYKFKVIVNFFLIVLITGFAGSVIETHNLFETCGRTSPLVKNYIYGGKSTMIEQWPWQVFCYFYFKKSQNYS
jgi:hypothetical protein